MLRTPLQPSILPERDLANPRAHVTWEGCTQAGRAPQSLPRGEVPLPSDKMQTSQRLTLQEQLVDEATTYVHQPGAELGQGLWQLKEALCLLTVGADQGFHAGRDVLESGEVLLCRKG